jgi:crotonobetainyl-CoA:carnitine CoA-transferase CaiB-like acyl-CoA transferase
VADRVWNGGGAGPLAGVRVLDLSRVLAGPYATMVLGDLGADVIKVERPGTGDDTRRWGPPFHGEDAVYFLAVNRGRRSLTLDLASEEGATIVRRLATAADVVVENFLPRHLRSLGLDGCATPPTRPCGCRSVPRVRTGPPGEQPGYDVMAQARGGMMSITGSPESGPTKVGVAISDVLTGLHAADFLALDACSTTRSA